MKIKMYQVVALSTALAQFTSARLHIKTAYKVSKLSQVVVNEMNFYTEKMNEIIQKYGRRNEDGSLMFSEDGTTVLLRKEDLSECQKEMNELDEVDVEVPDVKFSIDDFGDCEISLQEMNALSPFIDE